MDGHGELILFSKHGGLKNTTGRSPEGPQPLSFEVHYPDGGHVHHRSYLPRIEFRGHKMADLLLGVLGLIY